MVATGIDSISEIEAFLIARVAPLAQLIDQDPGALKDALRGMGERRLLSLRIPPRWGGGGMEQLTYRKFQVLMARYSGALAFLQTQHQSAAAQIFSGTNEDMKSHYLPKMADGEALIGIGLSHLRRPGPPAVSALPLGGDRYELSGEVPWVTGSGFFESFVLGATLPDGSSLYALVPFRETRRPGGESIALGESMGLAVMGVTRTVTVTLNRWIADAGEVIKIKPPGSMAENDRENVLFHGYNALGCARAGLDILERVRDRHPRGSIERTLNLLRGEWDDCYEAMLTGEGADFPHRLGLRAKAIDLAFKCAQAGVIASGGGGNYLDHPAQRVYREALLYALSGQTAEVMDGSLGMLAGP